MIRISIQMYIEFKNIVQMTKAISSQGCYKEMLDNRL